MRTLLIASLALLLAPLASAQDTEAQPKPSKEHEFLAQNLGTRTGTMKMWIPGTVEPVEMPFKETNASILNGFWVETEFAAGPYRGRGMTGYDPSKQKYIGTWTNNMSHHLSVMEGTRDETAHELTMYFTDIDSFTGKVVDMKSVTSAVPGKPETMTAFRKDQDTGKWVTTFVMTYDEKEK